MEDNIIAKSKWKFDKDVSNCFDDMLERSIPDYNTMRSLTLKLSEPFLQNKEEFSMLDLGCSNGINIDLFRGKYGNAGDYIGVDNSPDMLNKATERLRQYNNVKLYNIDVTELNMTPYAHDIITSILTIQFIPIEKRPALMHNIYNALKPAGILILVEKILQPVNIFDSIFVDTYYQIKSDNGYTNEQIQSKREALKGVLVPMTHNGNIELLKSAGFKYIDTFWKCLNFEGYIAIKEDYYDTRRSK